MNLNSNLIARLMINELPGLVGALQPLSGGAQILSELARRQHRQRVANAMVAGISGLLASGSNRYPLVPLQRLGAGLSAAPQSYGEGGARGPILDALGMDGRDVQSRSGAIARAALKGTAQARAVSAAAAPELAGEESRDSARRAAPAPRRVAGHATAARRKAAAGGTTLRKFRGTLSRRLDHPAVLPGGWQLYGYEKESGKPVYLGPDRELRIYA